MEKKNSLQIVIVVEVNHLVIENDHIVRVRKEMAGNSNDDVRADISLVLPFSVKTDRVIHLQRLQNLLKVILRSNDHDFLPRIDFILACFSLSSRTPPMVIDSE